MPSCSGLAAAGAARIAERVEPRPPPSSRSPGSLPRLRDCPRNRRQSVPLLASRGPLRARRMHSSLVSHRRPGSLGGRRELLRPAQATRPFGNFPVASNPLSRTERCPIRDRRDRALLRSGSSPSLPKLSYQSRRRVGTRRYAPTSRASSNSRSQPPGRPARSFDRSASRCPGRSRGRWGRTNSSRAQLGHRWCAPHRAAHRCPRTVASSRRSALASARYKAIPHMTPLICAVDHAHRHTGRSSAVIIRTAR